MGGCARQATEVTWQQDRKLVLESLREAQKSDDRLDGRLTQLTMRIAELQQAMTREDTKLAHIESLLRAYAQRMDMLEATHEEILEALRMHRATPRKRERPKRQAEPQSESSNAIPNSHESTIRSVVAAAHSAAMPSIRAEEKSRYSTAYLAFKSARYEDAIRVFREQLKQFPDGEYASAGRYWLAESLLAQQRNQEAMQAFRAYIENYPDGAKLAAAMLGMARAQFALGKKREASKTLEALLQRFPASAAADQGRALLSRVKSTH